MSPEKQKEEIDSISQSLRGTKPKILLVEDHPSDAYMFSRTLKMHHLEPDWADSVRRAVEYMKRQQYDVVFLDLKMNDSSDWRDVLEYIKEHNLSTRVIVLTGAYNSDDHECKEALKMGASAIILKPLTNKQVQLIFGTI